ncbi:MAG: bifunctional riboflavin kinase/FAD synthetase [Clostridia bacterium]|nr:bifunctional riboflavin kinase/FAD synthetase [Clostridia bacterium]
MRVFMGRAHPIDKRRIVAIGNFDGVHVGHQQLLKLTIQTAKTSGCYATVLTFFPHPGQVLKGSRFFPYLTTVEERIRLLLLAGVDEVVVYPFSKAIADMDPQEFIDKVLLRELKAAATVVGFNFTFGRSGMGSTSLLKKVGQQLGFASMVVPPVTVGNLPVSSSLIRSSLQKGDLDLASQLLGRSPALEGKVIRGQGLGHQLGFPTANIELWPNLLLPRYGVYATRVKVRSLWYRGLTNIGLRPTFGGSKVPTVETYLLDFQEDIYGEFIRLELEKYIRPEIRFSTPEQLLEQISQDVTLARQLK